MKNPNPKELAKAVSLSSETYRTNTHSKNGVAGIKEIVNEDEIWFAFRGSYTLCNWLYNLNLSEGIYPYSDYDSPIRIHRGFSQAYMQIREYILDSSKGYKKVRITGHSLGAAIALVCSVDIQYNLKVTPIVYGFGCPKTGNNHWIKSLTRRVPEIYLYQMWLDPVPYVPFHFEPVPNQKLLQNWFFNPHDIENYARVVQQKTK